MDFIRSTSLIIVLIGAINWGLVGAFDFNLVEFFFGNMTRSARIIYCIVGLGAVITTVCSLIHNEKHECDDNCEC